MQIKIDHVPQVTAILGFVRSMQPPQTCKNMLTSVTNQDHVSPLAAGVSSNKRPMAR